MRFEGTSVAGVDPWRAQVAASFGDCTEKTWAGPTSPLSDVNGELMHLLRAGQAAYKAGAVGPAVQSRIDGTT